MLTASRLRAYRHPTAAWARSAGGLQARRIGTTSDAPVEPSSSVKEAFVFIDLVFPVRFGAWDLRHYIGLFREDHLLQSLDEILQSVKSHDFRVISIEPQHKDGGVFVKFAYKSHDQHTLDEIMKELQSVRDSKGGFPNWTGLRQISGSAWLVRGKPWREDLRRFPSSMLKVAFEGPDILEERLYEIFRPYGRILDLTPPTPGTAGALRSSIITYRKARAAATARNCVHGFTVPNTSSSTRLNTTYERPIKAHAIRDFVASHPRIFVPVLVFLIGTITYTIFDPIRVTIVQGKLLDWFDYRKFTAYQWLRANTVDRLSFALSTHQDEVRTGDLHSWKERRDAEESVRAYLNDSPNTVAFVYGPQGSGKSSMLSAILKENERPVLIIDCAELYKANSDSALVTSLAKQTGYWPVFPFINSLSNLIDIASVGLIGQKAGLSTSLEAQVQNMLEVVGTGLKRASSHAVQDAENRLGLAASAEKRRQEEAERRVARLRGTWHDPRIDCVAGLDLISELAIGDELMRPEDFDEPFESTSMFIDRDHSNRNKSGEANFRKVSSELQELYAKPIVIIKNFATKHGRDEIIDVLAKWSATLVNNNVAHVVVVSDNRENARALAQALPSKPLQAIALSDADASSAISFVEQKLRDTGTGGGLAGEQKKLVECLGGRASDLETLVHKVRSGQRVEDAVEDIINRGVNELRKTAFGEDIEDAKSLSWSREQAWTVLKQLANSEELPYHNVLLDFPFKGDETALRSMEHAELIGIGTNNGRPSTIKPGRPVYRYVFQRLVADPVLYATQEISYNNARIANAESTLRSCEDELTKLSELAEPVPVRTSWLGKRNPATARAVYLLKKIQAAETTIEKLEAVNSELKGTLSKNR